MLLFTLLVKIIFILDAKLIFTVPSDLEQRKLGISFLKGLNNAYFLIDDTYSFQMMYLSFLVLYHLESG